MAPKKTGANADADTPTVQETKDQEAAVEEAAASEAAEAGQPTEFYRVSVNPRLRLTDRVSIGGFMVYSDPDTNRTLGNEYMDDIQWESIQAVNKDQDTGLQLIVRQKINPVGEEG